MKKIIVRSNYKLYYLPVIKNYFINYNKSRDACSIIWESTDYDISTLEAYITSIQCDDGEDLHELINSEWPDSEGKDDFKIIELNDFEAIQGDNENDYLLCYTAVISLDLDKHPIFKKALDKADNQIVARISFKKDGKPLVDSEGYAEYLFEMDQDQFVELEEVE